MEEKDFLSGDDDEKVNDTRVTNGDNVVFKV